MDIFGSLKEKLLEMFNEWLTDLLETVFRFLAQGLFAREGLTGLFADFYAVFITFGGALLLAILLYRILNMVLQEGAYSDVNMAELLLSTLKASAMVLVFPVLLVLAHDKIVAPLGEYFFVDVANSSADTITSFFTSNNTMQELFTTGSISALLFLLFLVVVFTVFAFKMCVYHADFVLLQILAIGAAVSIASDNYDYSDTWARESISQVISIIIHVLLMAALLSLIANLTSWYQFMLIIGCGILIIRGPTSLRSIWYSSGGAKGALNAGKVSTRMLLLKMKGR
ncbi:MAG: hypothetical protein UHX00_01310 [Caryophanon sp.]|nr:hypothetical protein [Caryophanon sp.]